MTWFRSRLPSRRPRTSAARPMPVSATARRGSIPICTVSRSRHTGSKPAFSAGLTQGGSHPAPTFRKALAPEFWLRSPGSGALAQEPWLRSPGSGALAQEPWPGSSGLGPPAGERPIRSAADDGDRAPAVGESFMITTISQLYLPRSRGDHERLTRHCGRRRRWGLVRPIGPVRRVGRTARGVRPGALFMITGILSQSGRLRIPVIMNQ
jgi:hypothetical protein